MHPLRKQRIYVISIILIGSSLALSLVLSALSRNIDLFYSPSQFHDSNLKEGAKIRAGGMVKKGSFVRVPDELEVSFVITDFNKSILVTYSGILPNLFSENSGVVVKGIVGKEKTLEAFEVLAKHDENYMPPEVQKTLKSRSDS